MRGLTEHTVNNGIFGRDKPFEIEKRLLRNLMAFLGDPPVNLVLWNGSTVLTTGGKAAGTIIIRNRKTLLKLLVRPELHFGDAYSNGDLEVEGDLTALLESIFRSKARAADKNLICKYLLGSINSPKPNSLDGSRDNIHHHYDIGNDFYRL